jgi:hypothetical protein
LIENRFLSDLARFAWPAGLAMAGRSESQPQPILLAAFVICAMVNICSRKIVRWLCYIRHAPDRGVETFFNHFLEYFIRLSG